MSPSVYEPAREIVKLVDMFIGNVGRKQSISEKRAKGLLDAADEACASELVQLDEEDDATLEEIEE